MNPTTYIPRLPPPAGYAAVILSTNYLRPLEDRFEVELELAGRELVGDILLDTLLANASATRRYFVLKFDGRQFEGASRLVESTKELEAYSKRAFRKSPIRLDKSLLLTPQVRALV